MFGKVSIVHVSELCQAVHWKSLWICWSLGVVNEAKITFSTFGFKENR